MFENLPRRGDFGAQPLAGLFNPVMEDGSHLASYFGLMLEGSWPYGVLRAESGTVYALLRKVVGLTTRGLYIQRSGEDGLHIDPACFTAASGGKVARNLRDGVDFYESSQYPGGPGFTVELGSDHFEWEESGGLVRLEGTIAGPGFHVYTPWPGGGSYYTSLAYRAQGQIMGEEVTGFVGMDQSYLPHGIDWNESPIWNRLQGAWIVFANEYHDGSVEWGHISHGAERFTFATIGDGTGSLLADTTKVSSVVEFSGLSRGFVDRIVYDCDGDAWEFVKEPAGDMLDFSAARPGWFGQVGRVGRVGETRTRRRWWAWQEVFPSRLA